MENKNNIFNDILIMIGILLFIIVTALGYTILHWQWWAIFCGGILFSTIILVIIESNLDC